MLLLVIFECIYDGCSSVLYENLDGLLLIAPSLYLWLLLLMLSSLYDHYGYEGVYLSIYTLREDD